MSIRVIIGDAREKLADLPDESVHCVVTSPPYFGLRDYGVAGQIGLEPTPAEFVAVMVEVFREVRRVLRPDGTLWLNLGDSYAGSMKGSFKSDEAWQKFSDGSYESGNTLGQRARTAHSRASMTPPGLKPKDLIGIPWRVAFALQADGWYLRQDIIWAKPNPMPESVTDRCTKAHEYLFLLSKSARYHYDAEAIAENSLRAGEIPGGCYADKKGDGQFVVANRYAAGEAPSTRNRRSVWTVATQTFKEAHFATFPPDLIEPCIKAGCPKETCKTCGAPWRMLPASPAHYLDGVEVQPAMPARSECGHDTPGGPPGTVLDPFGGAGTTGLVADRLQRNAILIELNPAYAAMAKERISDDAPLFAVLS